MILGEYCRLYGIRECTCCTKSFWKKYHNSVTCSPECARKQSTYRKIVHEYEYKGEILLLESSWEVEIANWLQSKDITFTRPKHIKWIDSTGKGRRYFPDFYVPSLDLYLDPKNDYQIEIGKEKLEYISERYKLIYGKVEYLKTEIEKLI